MSNRNAASRAKARFNSHRETTVTAPVLYSTRLVVQSSRFGIVESNPR
jgi:hypothetical protein